MANRRGGEGWPVVKAVVLAAGKGTRMHPLTHTRPKMLVPIANEPILAHILRRLVAAGVSDALVVLGHLRDQIEAWIERQPDLGLKIALCEQPAHAYGTGAAALVASDWVGDEPFVLVFGDIMAAEENFPRIRAVVEARPEATVLTVHRADSVGGGAVFVEEGRVVRIVEKPTPEEARGGLVNAGIFVLQPSVFEKLRKLTPSRRGEYELTDVFRQMIGRGEEVTALELEGYWSNVSGPAEILQVGHAMLERLEARSRAEGHNGELVLLGRDVQVDPAAIVHGPVMLGDGTRLLGRCHVGPYACIGCNCEIGDGASVIESAFLDDAVLERDARVGSVVLGQGAHVSEGTWLYGSESEVIVIGDRETYSIWG